MNYLEACSVVSSWYTDAYLRAVEPEWDRLDPERRYANIQLFKVGDGRVKLSYFRKVGEEPWEKQDHELAEIPMPERVSVLADWLRENKPDA